MPKCRVMIWLSPVWIGTRHKIWVQTQFFSKSPMSGRLSYLCYSYLLELNSEIHTRHNTSNTGCWNIHVCGIWESQLSCRHDTSGKPMKLVDIVQLIWSQISRFKAIAFRSWRKEGVPDKERRIPYKCSSLIVENWARAATGADSSSFFWVLTRCCVQEAIRLQLRFSRRFPASQCKDLFSHSKLFENIEALYTSIVILKVLEFLHLIFFPFCLQPMQEMIDICGSFSWKHHDKFEAPSTQLIRYCCQCSL